MLRWFSTLNCKQAGDYVCESRIHQERWLSVPWSCDYGFARQLWQVWDPTAHFSQQAQAKLVAESYYRKTGCASAGDRRWGKYAAVSNRIADGKGRESITEKDESVRSRWWDQQNEQHSKQCWGNHAWRVTIQSPTVMRHISCGSLQKIWMESIFTVSSSRKMVKSEKPR